MCIVINRYSFTNLQPFKETVEFVMAAFDTNNTLTLAHLNINGLTTKVPALKQLMKEHDVDIMSINETKVCGDDKGLNIPGYKLYRRDRDECVDGRDGGGVALYVRKKIPHTEIPENDGGGEDGDEEDGEQEDVEVESLWIRLDGYPLVVGTMYRPPDEGAEYLDKMKADIRSVIRDGEDEAENSRFVLMGDLNFDDSSQNSSIQDIENTFNCEQLVTKTTRATKTSSTLLDVILTDIPQSMSNTKVTKDLPKLTINRKKRKMSDHYMVSTVLHLDGYCEDCERWFKNKRGLGVHRRHCKYY